MGTISQELTNFRKALNGKTAEMNSMCSDITSKLNKFSSSCPSMKAKFSAAYQSQNKELVLSSFDCIAKIYSEIESSIDSTLKPMVTNSSTLVDNVGKLDDINKEIEEQQKVLNNNKGTDKESVSRRCTAQGIINTKNVEFNILHNESLLLLSRLKSMDKPIVIPEFNDTPTTKEKIKNINSIIVTGGSIEPRTYVASNGVTVNHYLYVPKTNSTEKKPILTYFHGIQDTIERNMANNYKYGGGLAGLIQTGQLSPSGIIIFPQATGGTNDKDFYSKPYQEAVIELIKDVAANYNGDLNRLSVAGHSNGGAAAQHIVNNYPGFFASCALMGISSNAKEGIAQTHLYALVGANDHTMDSYGRAISYARNNNQMYKVYNMGHDIQTIAFKEPVEDEYGNSVMLVDWLMSKTLNG